MKNSSILLALPLTFGIFAPNIAQPADTAWVQDLGTKGCLDICGRKNMRPVHSGNYSRSNESFYICKGNAHGEGERGGYNLEPSWSRSCIVGWGGKEIAVNPFQCLCEY